MERKQSGRMAQSELSSIQPDCSCLSRPAQGLGYIRCGIRCICSTQLRWHRILPGSCDSQSQTGEHSRRDEAAPQLDRVEMASALRQTQTGLDVEEDSIFADRLDEASCVDTARRVG